MKVPLKYLSKFWNPWNDIDQLWKNLVLTWSANCFISNAATNQATTFTLSDTKLYLSTVTLSTDDNINYCSK